MTWLENKEALLKFQHLKYFAILLIGFNFQKAQGQSSLGYVEGDVIIKFKESFDTSARQGISGDPSVLTLQGVSKPVNLRLESSFNNFSIQHYSGVGGGQQSTEDIIEQVRDHPGIEYIEPNYIISKTSVDVQSQSSRNPDSIFAREAHNALQALSNDPIVFAVLDTGVDVTHADLQNVMWENRNELPGDGIDNDGNGFVDDINGWNFADNNGDLSDCDGHGTHVSGIIQQTVTSGFSDNTSLPFRIMGLKFLGCDGIGSTSNAINAIDYAIDNGAKVLNNSWGNDTYSNALHEAVVRSYNARTVFVAAAGNNASDNDITPFYPASYPVPHVISVAATTFNDGFADSFSNFGLRSVHIGAPGVGVQSAYPNDQNVRLSGTSMAAPFVSAVTGLMLNEQPLLNGYQIKQILLESAQELPSLVDYVEGRRRLHALQAVLAAQRANSKSHSMPEYNSRVFSSEVAGGCGLVHKMYSEMHRIQSQKNNVPKGRGGHLPKALFGLMLALPLMVWTYLKQKAMKSSKRKYERYQVDIPLHISIDNHFVSAHLFSISQGGAGLSVGKSTHLKKGSQIDLLLSAHNENVTISGRIVWASNDKIGIQFKQEAGWIKQLFSVWNLSMVKDS